MPSHCQPLVNLESWETSFGIFPDTSYRQRNSSGNSNIIIKTVALQDSAFTCFMSTWSITLCNLYYKPVHGGSSDLELTFLWCFIWFGMWIHQTVDTGPNKSTFYSQNYTSWWKNGCSCSYKFCVYTDWVMCALCLQPSGRWLGINNYTF